MALLETWRNLAYGDGLDDKRKKNYGLDIFRLRRESMSRFFLTQQRLSRAL